MAALEVVQVQVASLDWPLSENWMVCQAWTVGLAGESASGVCAAPDPEPAEEEPEPDCDPDPVPEPEEDCETEPERIMFAGEHPTQSTMKKSRIAAMRADREGLNPDQTIGSAMGSARSPAEDCESVASMRASKENARGGSGLCEKQFTQEADRLWIQDTCGIAGKKMGSE